MKVLMICATALSLCVGATTHAATNYSRALDTIRSSSGLSAADWEAFMKESGHEVPNSGRQGTIQSALGTRLAGWKALRARGGVTATIAGKVVAAGTETTATTAHLYTEEKYNADVTTAVRTALGQDPATGADTAATLKHTDADVTTAVRTALGKDPATGADTAATLKHTDADVTTAVRTALGKDPATGADTAATLKHTDADLAAAIAAPVATAVANGTHIAVGDAGATAVAAGTHIAVGDAGATAVAAGTHVTTATRDAEVDAAVTAARAQMLALLDGGTRASLSGNAGQKTIKASSHANAVSLYNLIDPANPI